MLKTVFRIFRPEPKCRFCGGTLPHTPSAEFCSRDCYDSYQYLDGNPGYVQ